jgi:hypothetical protein
MASPASQSLTNYILSMEPHRDMKKYVQGYAPDLFDETIQNQVDHVLLWKISPPYIWKRDKHENDNVRC